MLVFEGKKPLSEIKNGGITPRVRQTNYQEINIHKFTCELWKTNKHQSINKQDEVSEITTHDFPYLDLDCFCNNDRELEFQVHLKSNKNLNI